MIELKLTEQEVNVFLAFVDVAVKSEGIRALREATHLVAKVEGAVQAANVKKEAMLKEEAE